MIKPELNTLNGFVTYQIFIFSETRLEKGVRTIERKGKYKSFAW